MDSIVHRPLAFARNWYKAEDIHRLMNQRAGGFGEMVEIPEDVRSIEFAKFMAEQYQLAMAKGAELAVAELRNEQKQIKAPNSTGVGIDSPWSWVRR